MEKRIKAEKLKKIEENLVKTVEQYSDYAKKIVTENSNENISDKMKQIVCLDIEKLFLEEKLINIKHEENIWDGIWDIVYNYKDYYKNFTAELRKIDSKFSNALDSSAKVVELYNSNISKNSAEYEKNLKKLKKLKGNQSTNSNKHREEIVKNSRKNINNIYTGKESLKTHIKNMFEHIKRYPEYTHYGDETEVDKIIFNKFDTEYEKFSSNNNECFKYEIVNQLIDEYNKVKEILYNVRANMLMLKNFVDESFEKKQAKAITYDGYYDFLRKLSKNNEIDTADDLEKELKKKFSTKNKIFQEINKMKQSSENNKKIEINNIEKQFTNKYKNKEIIKLKDEKFSELEKNFTYNDDEDYIKERKQKLDNKIKETKSSIKDDETTKKSYNIIKEFSKYNKTNKVLSIGGIKYSYKIYCEEILSYQSRLIEEAKNTQKLANIAKQTIKDIYDLENKVSELEKNKDKNEKEINEINIKIVNLKKAYDVNIQKLSEFSTIIENLKIVDVDKLKL